MASGAPRPLEGSSFSWGTPARLRSQSSALLVKASQARWAPRPSASTLVQGGGAVLLGSFPFHHRVWYRPGLPEGPDRFPEGGQPEGKLDRPVRGEDPHGQEIVVGSRPSEAVADEEEIIFRWFPLDGKTCGLPAPDIRQPPCGSRGQGGNPKLVGRRVPVTRHYPRDVTYYVGRRCGITSPSRGRSGSSRSPGCQGASHRR